MNPLFLQYTPFFLAVLAVGLGVIYSNSRITDIKDLIRSEINGLRQEMKADLRAEIGSLRVEMHSGFADLKADIAKLDQRLQRLEHERIIRS